MTSVTDEEERLSMNDKYTNKRLANTVLQNVNTLLYNIHQTSSANYFIFCPSLQFVEKYVLK